MGELMDAQNENVISGETERVYRTVRGYVVAAQRRVYSAVNAAMVEAYWNIGRAVYQACGENERAAYGKQVLAYLSLRLTEEFEKALRSRIYGICGNSFWHFQNATHCVAN